MRRLGGASEGDQVAVLLKLARNAEEKLSDADQALGFLRQILDVDPRNGFAYLELERIMRANERWYDLVEVLGKHADMEAAAGRKPTELALRVAIADVWEKELDSPESAAEALEKVLEVAPDNVPALLDAGAAARALRALGRRRDGARARGGGRGRAGGGRRDPVPATPRILRKQEADPAEIERALLRALDADPTHRPDAGGARGDRARGQGRRAAGAAARARPRDRTPTTTSGARGCARSRRSTPARSARPPRRSPTSSASSRWTRTRSLDASSSPTRSSAAGRVADATRLIGELVDRARQGQARQGRRPLAHPARHPGGGARGHGRGRGQLRRRLQARSRRTRRPSPRSAGSPSGAGTSRRRASTTARCCCRTSTRRPPASRRRRST